MTDRWLKGVVLQDRFDPEQELSFHVLYLYFLISFLSGYLVRMAASIPHLDRLLEQLAAKTKYPLDIKGLYQISLEVGLKEKYLYEYILRKKEKARREGRATISVHSAKLDTAAQYLGFKTYQAFVDAISKPVDPILQSLIGNYYSYVRRNDDQGYILRSPVRMYEDQGKVLWELKGPMRSYKGEVKLRHGCLFILMEEEIGKQIHHVYKIGTRQRPDVLQGIFSGVSTTFDPIGGRTVLVRSDAAFDNLHNKEASVKELSKSDVALERGISNYLKDFASNNLRIDWVVKFGEADLSR